MPFYKNYRDREVVIFLKNTIPIKFGPKEEKFLKQEGLEQEYRSYLIKIDKISENKNQAENVIEEKEKIIEVKQPPKNKELITEPITETTKKTSNKKQKKIIKESEGLTSLNKEIIAAKTFSEEEFSE